MNIEIKIDKKYQESKIIIESEEITDEISNIISIIKARNNNKIKVFLNEDIFFLDMSEVESAYANDKKVFIKTSEKTFTCKERLYELEKIFSSKDFIRISNSEIINLNKVKSINTKITGTIEITFFSGYKTYSSRRYINKIKEALGI